MPSHKEQMKAQHSKTEVVVVSRSVYAMKRFQVLHFGWDKVGYAYLAQVELATGSNLE
jgi:hypothetical protein